MCQALHVITAVSMEWTACRADGSVDLCTGYPPMGGAQTDNYICPSHWQTKSTTLCTTMLEVITTVHGDKTVCWVSLIKGGLFSLFSNWIPHETS